MKIYELNASLKPRPLNPKLHVCSKAWTSLKTSKTSGRDPEVYETP